MKKQIIKTEYWTHQQFAFRNTYTNNLCLLPTIAFYIKYFYVYWKRNRDTLQLLCYYIALNKWNYLIWLQGHNLLHRCFEQTHIKRCGRIHTQDKHREKMILIFNITILHMLQWLDMLRGLAIARINDIIREDNYSNAYLFIAALFHILDSRVGVRLLN